MPPLPSVPNVLKIALDWSIGGDLSAATILHWKYSGTAPDDATCAAIASLIYTQGASDLPPFMQTADVYTNTTVTDLSTPSGGQGDVTTGGTGGTRSGNHLPAGAAAVLNYKILRRYRGGKPRSYFPFGTDADLTSALVWGSSFISAVEAALTAFYGAISSISSGGTTLTNQVSVSYFSGFTVVTNPVTGRARNVPTRRATPIVDNVIALTMQPLVGSQRRRNRAA